jgi:hypothetical protein
LVNVWAILVADPESSVVAKGEAFAVNGDTSVDGIPATPSITKKRSSRERRKSRVGNVSSRISIKPCAGSFAIRSKEKGSIFVSEDKIRARRICDGSVGLGRKLNIEFVNPGLEVRGTLSIPLLFVNVIHWNR